MLFRVISLAAAIRDEFDESGSKSSLSPGVSAANNLSRLVLLSMEKLELSVCMVFDVFGPFDSSNDCQKPGL
jgi:hypothetical protein